MSPVALRSGADADAFHRLQTRPIAHRGLWSAGGAPENSLGAFQHAAEQDYGVELDVRLSADGEAMVFHDEDLRRLTGLEAQVASLRAEELRRLRLSATEEGVPSLAEALAVIGRRALVLIELKTASGQVGPLERRVAEVMLDHRGPMAVVSFNAYSSAWFADHHPTVLRGLNSHAFTPGESRLSREAAEDQRRLKHARLAHPDFLSLGLDMLPSPEAEAMRVKGAPVLAWTVRSQVELAVNRAHFDNFIFEGFVPS